MQTFQVRQRLVIFSIMFLVGLTGCDYQKVLKKGTPDQKLEAARKYYNKADYVRASIILEQLVGKFGRTSNGQEVYFLYAYCQYGMNDYALASYHFQNFVERYGQSKYTEQAAFMVARCEYSKSLVSELDQTNTKKAIEAIQLFINRYPQSSYVEKGNELIDQLRARLHEKAFRNAMLYYNMENYLSAYTALKNAIIDYPDLPNKEYVEYLIVRSSYLYAKQSVQKLQEERYANALDEARDFLALHADSEYSEDVKDLQKKSKTKLQELLENTKENETNSGTETDTTKK